jgi:hypothetical protein
VTKQLNLDEGLMQAAPDSANGDHSRGPDDEDLDEFVRGQQARQRVHPVRVVLAVASLLAAAFVLVPTVDELAYHFSSQGSAVDVGDGRPAVLAAVKDGTWVRANVILGNKAADIPAWRKGSLRFGPITIREVVGAPLVVEFDPAAHQGLLPFADVTVEGRLVSFSPTSGELQDVAMWFERQLGLKLSPASRAIVVDEKPGQLSTYLWVWIGALTLVVLSFGSIVRRLRPR